MELEVVAKIVLEALNKLLELYVAVELDIAV